MTAPSGRATVVLKNGTTYVCDRTEVDGRRLTFVGRLRVRDLSGERFYRTRTRTVPLRELRSIFWHDGRGER
jgi:hypothetical protein